jgi:alpha-mannosidase
VDIPHTGSRSGTASFLTVAPDLFIISAVKAPEDGRGLIVRGFNISDRAIDVRIMPDLPLKTVHRCRLDETAEDELKIEQDGSVCFPAGAHKIVSFRFE